MRAAFDEVVRAYNFRSMEPASLETLAVLRAKSGEQVDAEIYHFRDKGDREIGLRFDLTVGMTRFVAGKKGLRAPIKLASFGGAWRYDEPQHARYRWFHQWDVEIFGDPSIEADAEVMDISYNLFRRLGLSDVVLEIGDRRVVEDYIRRNLKVTSDSKLGDMMRALDKVSKKSEEDLIAEYARAGVGREEMKSLLAFGATRGPPEKVLGMLEEEHLESATGLAELRDSLRSRGIKEIEYNLSIVRGIDYYTAVVFEAVDKAHPDLGSLCGGGRYDILPKIFGRPDLAATGAAGGVDRIALSLADETPKLGVSAFVAYTEPALQPDAMNVLSSLRKAGIRSELGIRGKGLSRQLEDASARGFTYAVILGRKEIESNTLTLKDLSQRSERSVSPEDLVSELRSS